MMEYDKQEVRRGEPPIPEGHERIRFVGVGHQDVKISVEARADVREAAMAGWNACRKSIYAVCEDVSAENEKHREDTENPPRHHFGRGGMTAAKSIARGFNSMEASDDDNFIAALAALESATAEPGREAKRWLVEEHRPGGSICWSCYEHERMAREEAATFKNPTTVTPLYATPPDAAAEIERLQLREDHLDTIIQTAHLSSVDPSGDFIALWAECADETGWLDSRKAAEARAERAEAELAALKAEGDARVKAADAGMGVMASLAAAISLLERTPRAKKAAASDRMFDRMLDDYRRALDRARAETAGASHE